MANISSYSEEFKSYCTALDRRVSVEGSTSTLAPADTDVAALYEFDSGGLLPENLDVSRAIHLGRGRGSMMPVANLGDHELEELRQALVKRPELACIIADPILREGAPVISKHYLGSAFYVGAAVFHLFDGTTRKETAELAFWAPPFWTDLRILTSAPPTISPDRLASIDDMRKCAAAATTISCSAYDGESFLTWRMS